MNGIHCGLSNPAAPEDIKQGLEIMVDLISRVLLTGCRLCVDAELAIGQYRLGGGARNLWSDQPLRKMSSWVGNLGRPPYVIPRGSAGLKKGSNSILALALGSIGVFAVYVALSN